MQHKKHFAVKNLPVSMTTPKSVRAISIIGICGLLVVFWSSIFVANAVDSENPNQYMSEGILISRAEPSLAIDVVDDFEFVGRHPFAIRQVAAGERFVFVKAETRRIQKLLIVQFEGFLPGVDDFYRYDLTGKPIVAGLPFRSNGYAFNIVESAAANPESESAATYPFLEDKGFSVPDELMMWRSLTVADKARRKEMIIFYLEDVKAAGLALANLYVDDAATEVWIGIQEGLEKKANDSFRLTALDDEGIPISSGWSAIPNQFRK